MLLNFFFIGEIDDCCIFSYEVICFLLLINSKRIQNVRQLLIIYTKKKIASRETKKQNKAVHYTSYKARRYVKPPSWGLCRHGVERSERGAQSSAPSWEPDPWHVTVVTCLCLGAVLHVQHHNVWLFQGDVAVYSARLTCELCMPCSLRSSNEVLIGQFLVILLLVISDVFQYVPCSCFLLLCTWPKTNVLIVALSTAVSLIW
jgi:hypothetical protein